MSVKNEKFFEFDKLGKISKLNKNFLELYNQLSRNSGMCLKLAEQVIKLEGIIAYVQERVTSNFNFKLPAFLPKGFVRDMEEEERKLLNVIFKALQDSYYFLDAFISIRKKKTTGHDENEFIRKSMKKNKYVKIYGNTLKILEDVSEKWFVKIRDSRATDAIKKEFVEAVETVKTELRSKHLIVFEGSADLIGELKDLIEKAKTNLDKKKQKRLKILVPALKDVNDNLKRKELDDMFKEAEKLIKMKVKKGKGKRKSMAVSDDEEDDIPDAELAVPEGLTSVGPFGITRIDPMAHSNLKFITTYEDPHYMADLYFLSSKKKAKPRKGKLSPPFQITFTDAAARGKVKIPENAAHQCFVYPMEGKPLEIPKILSKYELLNDLKNLLEFGGFAFFDKNMKFLTVNAFEEGGNDLYFSGPHRLETDGEEKITKLTNEGRFAPVKLSAWKESEATKFAWVNPKEFGKVNHGSFIFQYEAKGWESTYFDIINVGNASIVRQKDSTVQLQQVFLS